MKLIFLVLVVVAAIWFWRSTRGTSSRDSRVDQAPLRASLEVVPCALCAVHVVTQQAFQGRQGWYCSTEHLHKAEPP